jgi:hypothetical protein
MRAAHALLGGNVAHERRSPAARPSRVKEARQSGALSAVASSGGGGRSVGSSLGWSVSARAALKAAHREAGRTETRDGEPPLPPADPVKDCVLVQLPLVVTPRQIPVTPST